ncbi:MAG: PIN domain-containing protein [Dehalococcoidia bacterium]|nr:PIN domain-containing protein [Dehalococcoidia bacterium]
MRRRAVLDANCLFGITGTDLLLRLAEADLFEPLWSKRILDEAFNALRRRGLQSDGLARRRAAMESAFPLAVVDGRAFIDQVPPGVDQADRHVVATAIAAGAGTIVTDNVRHFAPDELSSHRIAVTTLDGFLGAMFDADQNVVIAAVRSQAADTRNPPLDVTELTDRLARVAPAFAARMRESLGQ